MSAWKERGEGRASSIAMAMRRASALTAGTSGTSRHHKKFANGDVYAGGWRAGLPEGEGRYCWSDGSVYEGGWRVGKPFACSPHLHAACSPQLHARRMHVLQRSCVPHCMPSAPRSCNVVQGCLFAVAASSKSSHLCFY
jgi:hypothetical protein